MLVIQACFGVKPLVIQDSSKPVCCERVCQDARRVFGLCKNDNNKKAIDSTWSMCSILWASKSNFTTLEFAKMPCLTRVDLNLQVVDMCLLLAPSRIQHGK